MIHAMRPPNHDPARRTGRRVPACRAALSGLIVALAAAPASVLVGPGTAVAQEGVRVIAPHVVESNDPSISADGRWVVFGGRAGDRRTLYRTDRSTGVTVELSSVPGSVPTGDTILGRLSADGCVVVAVTQVAYDLFRDDDRGDRWDVYRLVVPECGGVPNAWELISIARTGVSRDGVFTDSAPALSESGGILAYVHQLDDAPEGVGVITVVDVTVPTGDPGREQQVAGMPVELPNRAFVYRGAREPVLSNNGRHLAFVSDTTASAPLPGWAAGPVSGEEATSQVFVWDRGVPDQRRSVRLVSGRAGVPSLLGAHSPAMSEDGRIIAFVSADRTLVPAELPPCAPACPTQVYRFDRDTDRNSVYDEIPRVEPLSIASAVDAGAVTVGVPVAGDQSSWAPALNGDGSQVAFVTDATNLLASRRGGGGGALDGDLLVAEMELGALRRVLDGADVTDVPGAHGNPVLSRTGQLTVFDTIAARVLAGDQIDPHVGRSIAAVEVTPRLSLAELDFGSVVLNLESTELYVRVQNAGPAAFEPASVDVSNNFKVTGGSCARGILVAAGSSCSVNLTFTPTAQRGYTGTLTVTGAGENAPSVTTTVRGSAGDPELQADPGGVDFERGIVGESSGRIAIGIEQIAFIPTRIVRIGIGGTHPNDFQVLEQSCTGRYFNPQASCAVEVEFRPTGAGYRSALLVVTTEIGAYTTAVLGGYARYQPTFETATETVAAGDTLGIGLKGFPADSMVSIGFDDGAAPIHTLRTNEEGSALAIIQLPSRLRAESHRLVASASGSAVATASIAVTTPERPNTTPLPGLGLG
jgi:Tol biopolymer transport system component